MALRAHACSQRNVHACGRGARRRRSPTWAGAACMCRIVCMPRSRHWRACRRIGMHASQHMHAAKPALEGLQAHRHACEPAYAFREAGIWKPPRRILSKDGALVHFNLAVMIRVIINAVQRHLSHLGRHKLGVVPQFAAQHPRSGCTTHPASPRQGCESSLDDMSGSRHCETQLVAAGSCFDDMSG
jgi:hypothetical protein